ncbi:ferritin [Actinosynnema sp. NPDC047251]|uniref:Ferritin n=1 Tax=Saccharothrix espanaensis (strain ATCC 51144 / DSM 44229 / JCM 9112 / NBRC 15066 / NRRL 15764) TaxID=1179773 RepID=K0JNM4_SACES|nr:ferritin [Saccharothrix espanaensis]CCH27440.1 putative bacterioferritin [Saccharothrix espanaensis DSM 44229]
MASNVKQIPARASRFHELLQEQVRHEFTASQQYTAIAVWYDNQDLPRLAAHFYAQALEERNHAMMIVQYLLDSDLKVTVPGVDEVRNDFSSAREPVELALQQERTVTDQIVALARTARDEGDYLGEQFLQWFLKEQVEEVASMSTLLTVVDRAEGNLFHVENFLVREASREESDPTAPRAAGGAL